MLFRKSRSLLVVAGVTATTALLVADAQVDKDRAARRLLRSADAMAEGVIDSMEDTFTGIDECHLVANLAGRTTVNNLEGDLSHNVASCVNEESGTLIKFLACLSESFEEYTDGLDEFELQHAARLELCALTGGGIYDPDLDEEEFVEGVDHAFLPYRPGAIWVYQVQTDEGLEEITVTVTGETKDVDDIECIVVRDVVTLDGEFIEDTDDWYAQHMDGTVWYMGEVAQNFEDGDLVDLDGSWEAGEDGGMPGVVMMANPIQGVTYRQELLLNEAEDAATVLAVDETVVIRMGTFTGCLKTLDFTPLEPTHFEHKYYAPGVGLVLEVNPDTGERLELISYTPGS